MISNGIIIVKGNDRRLNSLDTPVIPVRLEELMSVEELMRK